MLQTEFSYQMVQDSFDGRTGEAEWSITLTRNGESYTTPFTMGCGHRIYSKRLSGLFSKGQAIQIPYGTMSIDHYEANKASIPKPPGLEDVLYCLVFDAQCCEGTFEDFCQDLGYNDDSIQDLDTYRACVKTRLALTKLGFNLTELIEQFQDY